jgi:hypothetical protein
MFIPNKLFHSAGEGKYFYKALKFFVHFVFFVVELPKLGLRARLLMVRRYWQLAGHSLGRDRTVQQLTMRVRLRSQRQAHLPARHGIAIEDWHNQQSKTDSQTCYVLRVQLI